MRWLFMIFGLTATALFFNAGPRLAFYLCFVLLAVNFASFCLLYDAPVNRARQRVAQQLAQISGKGVHADRYERLQSMKITPSEDDRRFRLTPLSGINIVTGAASAMALLWALLVRLG